LDLIIINKADKLSSLLGVAIPLVRNVTQKENENKLKYKSLSIEMQRM